MRVPTQIENAVIKYNGEECVQYKNLISHNVYKTLRKWTFWNPKLKKL